MKPPFTISDRPQSLDWGVTISLAISLVILVAAATVQVSRIGKFMPYPQHIDEHHLTDRAATILVTGDFNPHFFDWPSWPIYLTAGSMTVGYLSAASALEVRTTADIGCVSFPFITHPRIVWAPRLLFAFMGLAAPFLMGLAAYRIWGNPTLLFLVPFTSQLSEFYSDTFLSYANVDTVGVFSIACLYLFLFSRPSLELSLHSAAVAGALTGLVLASKYSLFLVFVPSLLIILTQRQGRRLVLCSTLLVAAALAFLVLVPYSLLDLNTFLDHLGTQVHHYSSGHPGFDGPKGAPQLRHYLGGLVEDYGWATVPFFIAGLTAMVRARPRAALVFLSFPVLHLLFFSSKSVHFTRNVALVYVCYSVFIAIGLVLLYQFAIWALRKMAILEKSATQQRTVALVVVLLTAVVLFPIGHAIELARMLPDSRHLAAEWILANVKAGSHLLVPSELSMDTSGLADDYRISTIRLTEQTHDEWFSTLRQTNVDFVLLPYFDVTGKGLLKDSSYREKVARANSLSDSLEIVHRIEGAPAHIDWGRMVSRSPRIHIVRVNLRGTS